MTLRDRIIISRNYLVMKGQGGLIISYQVTIVTAATVIHPLAVPPNLTPCAIQIKWFDAFTVVLFLKTKLEIFIQNQLLKIVDKENRRSFAEISFDIVK